MHRFRHSCVWIGSLLLSIALAAPSRGQLLGVDFSSGTGGFTVTNGLGAGIPAGPWTHSPANGTWFANGGEGVVNSALDSPTITVPNSGSLALYFQHRYNFEDDGTIRWDGGQVRYSRNGAPYVPVIAQAFLDNGYATDRTIQGNSPPLIGQFAFNNTSPGFGGGEFIVSAANLGTFAAGDTLSLRFIGSWDESFIQPPAPNWEIRAINVDQDDSLPPLPVGRPSSLKLEYYTDIQGLSVSDLLASPKFPNNPDIVETVEFSEVPVNRFDFYGVRLSGFFTPDQTGLYDFYMASDDRGELYLSTDADPANKVLIAREPEWNVSRDFASTTRRNPAAPENRSTALFPDGIELQAGLSYYVEALMKEHGGGDNLAFTAALRTDPSTPGPIPVGPLGGNLACNCGVVDIGLLDTVPIPEPGTWALVLLAIPGVMWMRWRRWR